MLDCLDAEDRGGARVRAPARAMPSADERRPQSSSDIDEGCLPPEGGVGAGGSMFVGRDVPALLPGGVNSASPCTSLAQLVGPTRFAYSGTRGLPRRSAGSPPPHWKHERACARLRTVVVRLCGGPDDGLGATACQPWQSGAPQPAPGRCATWLGGSVPHTRRLEASRLSAPPAGSGPAARLEFHPWRRRHY